MPEEHANKVTMMGKPMTLLGKDVKVGEKAPDYVLFDGKLNPVKLNDSSGKIRLISVVPSLDTEVCDIQTRMFSREVQKLGDNILFITVSMDLPFAQSRWVEENNMEGIITLSDFNDTNFGLNYGFLIKEMRLLTRAVIIIDQNDRIIHKEIVPDLSDEPNYANALEAIRNLNK